MGRGLTSEEWRKVQCVVGGFCAMCISGQYYIVGNVGTYIESYLKERGDYPQEATWLISAFVTCFFVGGQVGTIIGGFLDRAIGSQLTTLSGLGLLILSSSVTCWTVRVSSVATTVTFGAIPSLGFGVVYGCPYSALNKHRFKNTGLVYGIVNAGFGGGAVVYNVVMSAFINPDNRAPDKINSRGAHFSQDAVLDRIPPSFLLLGGMYAVLVPVVVWGIRPPPPPSFELDDKAKYDDIKMVDHAKDPATPDGEKSSLKGNNSSVSGQKTYHTIRQQETVLQTTEKAEAQPGGRGRGGAGGGPNGGDLPPRKLFFYPAFYVIWVVVFLNSVSNSAVVGHYKGLGLTHIDDDMLLASLGMVGSLMSALGRPLWGVLVDYTSFKTTLVIQMALTCVCLTLWRVGLLYNVWLYSLLTVLLFALVSALPVLLVIASKGYFGQDHLVANMAVLWTAMTLQATLMPFVTSWTLAEYGWNGFLLLIALLTFAGMLVSLLLPRELALVSDVKKADDVKSNCGQSAAPKESHQTGS